MGQNIHNDNNIHSQTNIGGIGQVNVTIPKTRWQKHFLELKKQVENDDRYKEFIKDFLEYNTIKDNLGLERKLIDGGFGQTYIIRALKLKEKYAKRVVRGEMFLAQQKIDVEIFSIIDTNFYTYVFPLIESNSPKETLLRELHEKVVNPILNILNKEGEADDYLNYNSNDIFGMVYFLTGKCHLNWKDYDII
ncbi:ABC-three component system protein [Ornithobacterium rhinotracheale]